ncbi:hypothetical protein DFJ63DRAFT_335078 [Scheffersomyces coipomensis]|uniref:uncharacterized protein n=1 Tax=Scheffersomyces coipomensis TaxID=1788519 RepID=UPI00315D313A
MDSITSIFGNLTVHEEEEQDIWTPCNTVCEEVTDNETLQFAIGILAPEKESEPYMSGRTIFGYDNARKFIKVNSVNGNLKNIKRAIIVYHVEDIKNQQNGVTDDNLSSLVKFLFEFKLFFMGKVKILEYRFCCGTCHDQTSLDILLSFMRLSKVSFNNMDLTNVNFLKLSHFNKLNDIEFNNVKFKHWSEFTFPRTLKRLTVIVASPTPIKYIYMFGTHMMYTSTTVTYNDNEIKKFPIPDGLDYLKLDIPHLNESILTKLLAPISNLNELIITGSQIKNLMGNILPQNLCRFTLQNRIANFTSDNLWPRSLSSFTYIPLSQQSRLDAVL